MPIALYLVLGLMLALVTAGAVYVVRRCYRTAPVLSVRKKGRIPALLLAMLPLFACAAFLVINVTAAVIVLLHLIVAFLLFDLIALIVRLIFRKKLSVTVRSAAALLLTVCYLSVGWANMHTVRATHYTLTTDKDVGDGLRIVLMTDTHLSLTVNKDNFPALIERINAEKPDVVLFAGDFVDDDSDWADTEACAKALGTIDAPLGVWLAYGNHDEDQYAPNRPKKARLTELLNENGIRCLEEESVLLTDGILLTGRSDASTRRDRATLAELLEGTDAGLYRIVMDHEPNDYAAEAEAAPDLVLSGHTHGGHIWPAGQIGLLMGANDRIYGEETRGGTTFIVSSGVSGWAIPFKTGTFSEYVVIDIQAE